MLEKIIYADDYLETGEPAVRELNISPGEEIIKTAYKLPPETIKYIKNITPQPGTSFLLINALGASGILYGGGIWGQNRNGDYFAEADLIAMQLPGEAKRNTGASKGIPLKRYKTFENGHFFANHQNKDPNTAIGKILFSDYDMDMHRVLLIVEFWRNKDPILAGRIDHNLPVSTSMGCKVPGDYCTICGNYSRKPDRSDACIHIKQMKGQIMEDGRRVGMINKNPRFFDISKVFVGADATSKILMKVAGSNWEQAATYSYVMPRYYNIPFEKKAAMKRAELKKEVPPDEVNGKVLAGLQQLLSTARALEPTIPDEVLDEIPLQNDMQKVSAMLGLGFIPHEEELNHLGIDPERLDNVSPIYHEKTARMLSDYVPYRTIYDPYVSARILSASKDNQNEFHEKVANLLRSAGGGVSPAAFLIAGVFYSKILSSLAKYVGPSHPAFSVLANPAVQIGTAAGVMGAYGVGKSILSTEPRHNTVDSGQILVPDSFAITKLSTLYSAVERKPRIGHVIEIDPKDIMKVAYIMENGDDDLLMKYIVSEI